MKNPLFAPELRDLTMRFRFGKNIADLASVDPGTGLSCGVQFSSLLRWPVSGPETGCLRIQPHPFQLRRLYPWPPRCP